MSKKESLNNVREWDSKLWQNKRIKGTQVDCKYQRNVKYAALEKVECR